MRPPYDMIFFCVLSVKLSFYSLLVILFLKFLW
jgi:hypothetical protein